MTTRSTLRDAVKAAVYAAAGGAVKSAAIHWTDVGGMPVGDPLVALSTISDVRAQPVRETLTPQGEDLARSVADVRDLVVQIRGETLTADPLDFVDTIRLGLELEASRALLEAQCVIVSTDRVGSVDLTYGSHGQKIRARAFELALRASFERADPTTVGTITTVKVSGTTADPTITVPEDSISAPAEG